MAGRFELPHIDISAIKDSNEYSESRSRGDGVVRIREEHGRRLQNELDAALP